MKKVFKSRIFIFMLGVLVSGISVYGLTIASKDVSYDNTNSGATSNDVQGAIDELYRKANIATTIDVKTCMSGEGNRSCTISGLTKDKYYFCIAIYRGKYQGFTVSNATVLYSGDDAAYLDSQYGTSRRLVKANSTSMSFTITSTKNNGMHVACYHIVNIH